MQTSTFGGPYNRVYCAYCNRYYGEGWAGCGDTQAVGCAGDIRYSGESGGWIFVGGYGCDFDMDVVSVDIQCPMDPFCALCLMELIRTGRAHYLYDAADGTIEPWREAVFKMAMAISQWSW